jgi:aspartyl-tRNA(Asn)/glutamyl-tRNA(Gln) amidotransferase subunit A
MGMNESRYLSIAKAGEMIRRKQMSPVELVRECLEWIDRLNPAINAFITVTADRALDEAKKAETEIQKNEWRGPLHGIPVALKDFFDTAGVRTTAAAEQFRNRVPTKDANVVARLKNAGAIVLGKTNMHELGMGTTSLESFFGPVHNPWDQRYVAGGSSGGSAAAVAAGLVFATVDTDAIGSCRLPAACCGVVGFKPTLGMLSTDGILAGEPLDTETTRTLGYINHGAFTCRTAEDATILLNGLADSDAGGSVPSDDYRRALTTTAKPRIGLVRNARATAPMLEAVLHAAETLHVAGFSVRDDVEIQFPSFEFSRIEEDRKTISQTLFANIDALLLPTTTEPTPTIEEARKKGPQAVSSDNTFFCNYYGIPAASVACGFSENGVPLGLQIVGPQWGEVHVLNVVRAFQSATSWHKRHPSGAA